MTTVDSSALEWGHKPTPPLSAGALWGARLLVEQGHAGVSLLHDRQHLIPSFALSTPERAELIKRLDGDAKRERPGAISALLGYLSRRERRCDLADETALDVTLRGVRFRGVARGGYVYITATLQGLPFAAPLPTCWGCGTGATAGMGRGTRDYRGLCDPCRAELKRERREARTFERRGR